MEYSEELIDFRNYLLIINDKEKRCAEDFLLFVPSPNKDFDEHSFFTKFPLLIEQEIKEYLIRNNRKSGSGFYQTIEFAKKIYNDPELWHAIHNLRKIRNCYSHKLRNESEKDRLINDFLSHAEKANSFDGEKLFPIADYQNQRAVRVYYMCTFVWEFLCKLNGASSSFSLSAVWLKEYVDTVQD